MSGAHLHTKPRAHSEEGLARKTHSHDRYHSTRPCDACGGLVMAVEIRLRETESGGEATPVDIYACLACGRLQGTSFMSHARGNSMFDKVVYRDDEPASGWYVPCGLIFFGPREPD